MATTRRGQAPAKRAELAKCLALPAGLGLAGEEPDDELIGAMARHPTLVQRPIGRLPGKAILGRPPERLLELVER